MDNDMWRFNAIIIYYYTSFIPFSGGAFLTILDFRNTMTKSIIIEILTSCEREVNNYDNAVFNEDYDTVAEEIMAKISTSSHEVEAHSKLQSLFNHMSEQHDLILTEGEMYDIIQEVNEIT